jgi:hypothetical protein
MKLASQHETGNTIIISMKLASHTRLETHHSMRLAHIITARGWQHIITARGWHIITHTRGWYIIITARGWHIISTRLVHIITARGWHIISTRLASQH